VETTILAPVAQQFSQVQPTEFGRKIEELRRVVDRIVEPINEAVEANEIPVPVGMKLIASTWATVFGYEEFHGSVSPANLVTALAVQQQGNGQQQQRR
jgi:hypothetical protein